MEKIKSKKQLEIIISGLEGFSNPKIKLEQYLTPDHIVAEMVYLAYIQGNIENKIIIDFCSGTGKISLAASMLYPKIVIGIEIDKEAIKAAMKNRKKLNTKNVYFVLADSTKPPIKEAYKKDIVALQNPPFGILNKSHKDVDFVKSASVIASWIYSIHKGGNKKTRNFLINVYESLGFEVIMIKRLQFTIPKQFSFHKKPKMSIDVDLYVAKRK